MKKIVSTLVLVLFVTSLAQAGTALFPQSGTAQYGKGFINVPFNQATNLGANKTLIETGNNNILKDPGFESGTTSNVTFSGGALATVGGLAALSGTYGMDWDSNAAGQTATGAAITIPAGLKGKNAVVSCNIQTVSGVATHTLAAYDGTNAINPTTITSIAGQAVRTSVNFIMPSSGTITWQMKSVASNEPEIYMDDCIIEDAAFFNLGSGTFTTPEQAYTPTLTNAGTSPTAVNFVYSRMGDKMYVRGSFVAGTSPAASPLTVSLPSGFTVDSTKISNAIYQVIGYGNAQLGQTTWSLLPIATGGASVISFSRTDQTAITPMNGSNLLIAGNPVSFAAMIPITQFTDQSFYRADSTPASWSGFANGISSGCSTTSTTYADPSACNSIATTQTTARNITCSQNGTLPSISCNLARAGMHRVCALVQGSINTATANVSARLVDGVGTVIDPGRSGTITASGAVTSIPLCGTYNVTSVSSASVFKVQLAASANTASIANGVATSSGAIQWTVDELDAPMPAPYLTGSVTSNNPTGAERVERATFGTTNATTNCTASPCSYLAQSGSWLSSVTRTSTGLYVLNFTAGEFSAAPTCMCSTFNNGTVCSIDTSVTPSTTSVGIRTVTNGGTVSDVVGNVICMGPH